MLVAAIIASHFPALDVLVPKAFTLFGLSPCGSHRVIGAAPAPLFPSFFFAAVLLAGFVGYAHQSAGLLHPRIGMARGLLVVALETFPLILFSALDADIFYCLDIRPLL